MSTETPEQRLLDILGGIAMYNDKGYQWTRASEEEIDRQRASSQASIVAALEALPAASAARIPPELRAALLAGEASVDGSGLYRECVEACFKQPR